MPDASDPGTRAAVDTSGRHSRRINLTDAGSKRLAELSARMQQVEDDLLAGLPADDAAALRRVVARAARSLGEDPAGVCETVEEISATA